MQSNSDLNTFYELLDRLEISIGGRQSLGTSHGRMQWPERGVYFFFEPREYRSGDQNKARVVRVGTHALIEKSRTTLWKRLSQHRGTLNPRGGNHRGSIFRLLIGQALANRDTALSISSWGQGGTATRAIRLGERSLEEVVSNFLGAMTFVCLPVLDLPGKESARGVIERNSIALLSNFDKPTSDIQSASWLGHYSGRERVRRSGLWNNNHVDEAYDPQFLHLFENLINKTESC
jgi:hypothetical protein